MDFHILKMHKDKEVNKNVKNILLSMCDVRLFLTFASLGLGGSGKEGRGVPNGFIKRWMSTTIKLI
jgi:hypothetical protein